MYSETSLITEKIKDFILENNNADLINKVEF